MTTRDATARARGAVRTGWAARASLIAGSTVVALLLLELACRVASGTLGQWHNIILAERTEIRALNDGRLGYDRDLGWVASKSYTSEGRSYDADGWRRAPAPASLTLAEPPLLVVGDSIAHGDEVADAEAWPSLLQLALRRRVINTALTGYGLDQIVLRAEKVAREVRPAMLVLSFAADDLRRSEMRRVWGVEKPYFSLTNGTLVLHDVPVPASPAPADTLDLWQWLFGWSQLVNTVLRHEGWQFEWSSDHERVLARGEGERMACPLMKRIAALAVPTLVVAEYNRWVFQDMDYQRETRRQTALVLGCARAAGLQALDMFDTIDAAVRAQGLGALYRSSHPGPGATRLAADRIGAALARLETR
jgi:hypothetical protein